MLTPDQIREMAALDGRHKEEQTTLALQQGNEQQALLDRQAAEREQLGRRLGLPGGAPGVVPGRSSGPAPVVPASRRAIALRPGGTNGGDAA